MYNISHHTDGFSYLFFAISIFLFCHFICLCTCVHTLLYMQLMLACEMVICKGVTSVTLSVLPSIFWVNWQIKLTPLLRHICKHTFTSYLMKKPPVSHGKHSQLYNTLRILLGNFNIFPLSGLKRVIQGSGSEQGTSICAQDRMIWNILRVHIEPVNIPNCLIRIYKILLTFYTMITTCMSHINAILYSL